MPIFSFIKNLVGGQQQPSTAEHPAAAPAAAPAASATSTDTPNTPSVCEQSNHTDNSDKSNALTTAKPPLRPPPPMSTAPKNPSSRSKPPLSISDPNSSPKTRPPLTPVSGESLLRTESSSSVYRDFTGQGHADRGHWNDPPTAVFKSTNGTANATANAAGGGAQDAEADADDSLTEAGALESRAEMELSIRRILSERLQTVDTAEAMNRRVVEDTEKRLGVLWERMQLLDERLIAELNRLCALLDTDMHAEALGVYREVAKAYESELKWLVGIKRVIELSK